MKIKNTIFFLVLLIIALDTFAQVEFKSDSNEPYVPTYANVLNLDTAKMRVLYRLEILHDTINPNAVKSNNVMMLQIGKNGIDKYMDLYKNKGDSASKALGLSGKAKSLNDLFQESIKYSKGSLREQLFWNYPNGKLKFREYIFGGYYLYEEDIPKINWKLEQGVKTILDYPCQKATCSLFGRNYTVWYTMQVPIAKGPWKFSGLPGLILQVEDNQNQISWTCIGIENLKWIDLIEYDEEDFFKTSKADFLESFTDYKRNPGAIIHSSGMISGDLPEHAKKKRHYNPIER